MVRKNQIIEYLQAQNSEYLENVAKLNTKQKEHDQFVKNINELVKKENLIIVNVCKDKYGKDTYILLQDEREVFPLLEGSDFRYKGYYLKGSIVLFVISEEMYLEKSLQYTNHPYLEASCNEQGKLYIENLFTQASSLPFGGRGYGRMLTEAAESICKKSKYTVLHGSLSYVDAQTEEKKDHRNGFYEHLGFAVSYNDDKKEDGSFRKEIP